MTYRIEKSRARLLFQKPRPAFLFVISIGYKDVGSERDINKSAEQNGKSGTYAFFRVG